MSVKIDSLVKQIFSNPPQPSGSIQLNFDDSEMNIKDLFEFILTFFTKGMKMLFGNSNNNNNVNLNSLSNNDFAKITEYMNSVGFSCIVDIYSSEEANKYDFMSIKYTNVKITGNTKLFELKLPLKCNDKVYVISFDFL
tara:strand:- start:620 stop:1036 length:417 start_codon:yes stop_codon:yes gene_type:complete